MIGHQGKEFFQSSNINRIRNSASVLQTDPTIYSAMPGKVNNVWTDIMNGLG